MPTKNLFKSSNKNYTFLTESDFEIKSIEDMRIPSNNGQYGILLVYKDNCPFCIQLKTIIPLLAKEFTNLNLPFYLANQTDHKYLYPVKTVPAFYFIDSNNKLHLMQPEKRTVYEILVTYISELVNKSTVVPNSTQSPILSPSSSPRTIKKYHKTVSIPNSLYNESPHVIQLGYSDFIKMPNGDIKLRNTNLPGPGIIKAYANWCIFCKLKTDLIKKLASESKEINIYVIDLADDPDNPLNEIVKGYPTFLLLDGVNQIHQIGDQKETEDILNKNEASGYISQKQKHELIYAINSVMN